MTPEKLFHELLGLGLNWEVVESRFERVAAHMAMARCSVFFWVGKPLWKACRVMAKRRRAVCGLPESDPLWKWSF